MFTFLLLSLAIVAAYSMNRDSFTMMQRMSLSFENVKPYPKPAKPKTGTKGKGHSAFRDLMAVAKYAGTGVVALSGKIAGTVFLSNNVVRVWKKPNNVRNAFTQLARGLFSGVSTAFKGLTAPEIASWKSAAGIFFTRHVFGSTKPLKANTLFQRVNNNLTIVGITNIVNAPGVATPTLVGTALTGAAAAGAGTFTLDLTDFFAGTLIPATTYVKVFASRQSPISLNPVPKTLIGFQIPGATLATLDIAADYVARFGALIAGSEISIAVEVLSVPGSPVHHFHLSGKLYTNVIVAA